MCTIKVVDDSRPVVAFFRSCLRKTFRDQIIKSLRGLPGEHTHTTYRSQWLTTEVLELFERGEDFVALSILVDPLSESALPSRLMQPVVPPRFDPSADSWDFTFELGNFVTVNRRSEKPLSDWSGFGDVTPPKTFVSMYGHEWVKYHEVEYRKSKSDWKQAVDFVVEHWPEGFRAGRQERRRI